MMWETEPVDQQGITALLASGLVSQGQKVQNRLYWIIPYQLVLTELCLSQ